MRVKYQKSFAIEGYKRIFCYNCKSFLTQSYLGEKKNRIMRCKICKTWNLVSPPTPGYFGNQYGVFFGPNQSIFTAVDEKLLGEELGKPVIFKN